MSDHYYKNKLYPLQDRVLDLIGQTQSDFYLTGGTLLSRFVLHHRYSDDLDFFVNADPDFLEKVTAAMAPVLKNFSHVELSSQQAAYVRYFVNEEDLKLSLSMMLNIVLANHYARTKVFMLIPGRMCFQIR
jgi:predicted nucleotidyltransferase component of viral defense system